MRVRSTPEAEAASSMRLAEKLLQRHNLRQVRHSRGEIVSVDGAHLGHNNPAETGSRYHVNHVAVAGMPPSRGVKDEL